MPDGELEIWFSFVMSLFSIQLYVAFNTAIHSFDRDFTRAWRIPEFAEARWVDIICQIISYKNKTCTVIDVRTELDRD